MVLDRYQTLLFTFLFLLYFLVDLPFSIHKFIYFKWLMNGALAIAGLSWFLYEKEIKFPNLSNRFWIILCALFAYKIAQELGSNISLISSSTLDKMTFISLILIGYNLFLKGKIRLNDILMGIFIGTLIFLILTVINVISSNNFNWYERNKLAGSFGNINIAAEFLGMSLILQLSTLCRKNINKIMTFFLYGLSIITSIYLYFASCRSVFIALAMGIGALLYFKSVSKAKVFKWLSLVTISFCFLYGTGSLFKTSMSSEQTAWVPDLQKSVSTHTRYELVTATLQMILEHPWGVGAGEFEFAIMPYLHKMMPEFNENVIPHSPHNEYLRLIAEEGLPFTLLLLALVAVLLYERRNKIVFILHQYPIIAAFFTFWMIQSVFQFPFTNGFSFLLFCIILAFALYKICPSSKSKKNIILPMNTTFLFTSIYSALFACVFISEYLTLWQPHMSERSKIAYSLNSRNWYAGINHVHSLIDQQDYESARDILNTELKKRPHNFVALRYLIKISLLTKELYSVCGLMKQYDAYFNNKSSVALLRMVTCSKRDVEG
ncbi:MAG: O-antigen ligase family protein [Alphaproteobacteria bacterium]|nr:O-antigen ligase family protein [Alphaproteobacteria bacterium]